MFPFLTAIGAALGGFAASPVGSAVIGVAGKVIAGRAQAKASAEAGQLNLGKLRADAIANGFNPLTVLNATGGAGYQSGAGVPGFLSLAAGLIGPAMDDVYEKKRQQNNDGIANALMVAQTNSLGAQSVRAGAATSAASAAGVPAFEDAGYIPLWTAAGLPVEMNALVADRLGLKPGQVMLAQDEEDIMGEFGSIPGQFGVAADSTWESVKGWFGSDKAAEYLRRGHTGSPSVAVAGSVAPPARPLSVPDWKGNNRNPQPGWFENFLATP